MTTFAKNTLKLRMARFAKRASAAAGGSLLTAAAMAQSTGLDPSAAITELQTKAQSGISAAGLVILGIIGMMVLLGILIRVFRKG